jgi:hypothetical protein
VQVAQAQIYEKQVSCPDLTQEGVKVAGSFNILSDQKVEKTLVECQGDILWEFFHRIYQESSSLS